jgi:FtsH-binding integral membrane protein
MIDPSNVKSEAAREDNYASRAPVYAAIACAIIYAPLCVYAVASGGLIERVFVGGLGGCLLWIFVWIIGAIFIGMTETHKVRVIATGATYGAIVGLASGFVLNSWPYCSQPTDPTPQILVIGIGGPAILFHAVSFGRLGNENDSVLVLLSSTTFWALFGLTLATLSRLRRLKISRPLASD